MLRSSSLLGRRIAATLLLWFTLVGNLSLETFAFGIIESPKIRQQWNFAKTTAASVTLVSTIFLQLAAPTVCYAAGDIGKGEILFKGNCASCHIDGMNLVNEQRTLKKDALEKFGVGVDQPSIQNFVTNSMRHKSMVFLRVEGGKLNSEQWEDVTTYVADQAAGDKW